MTFRCRTISLTIFIVASIAFINFAQTQNERVILQRSPFGQKVNVYYLSNTIVIKMMEKPAGNENEAKLPDKISSLLEKYNLVSAQQLFPDKVNKLVSTLNRIVVIKYSSDIDPAILSSKLKGNQEVEWAEPKFIYPVEFNPDDPSYAAQYNLAKINASLAWDITKGDTSVIIGIVDTGIDWDHPDLSANIWINWNEIPNNGVDDDVNGYIDDYRGWDFGGLTGIPDNDPMEDRSDHGTHVAGIASAVSDNSAGIASIGFNCKIMAVKTSQDDFRSPSGSPYIAYGFEGIKYAADNGAKVINCSWGGSGFSMLGQEVINYAVNDGALIIAAAGNDNSSGTFFPSSYKGVISVASTNEEDKKSSFSNYGVNVDVSAPGSNIFSTWMNNTYTTLNGTSMASPLAAGLAALIASHFPNYTPLQIGEQMRVNCDDINIQNPSYINYLGRGRINAYSSVNNTSSISVRAVDVFFSDEAPGGNGDGNFQSGEAISVEIKFINFLNPTSNLNIYLESTNPYSTVMNGNLFAGAVATLDSFNNYSSKFTFTLSNSTPLDTSISFKINFIDGSYTDFQAIETIANQTYATHAGNDVALTITSKGTLAFNDFPDNTQGSGFTYLDGLNLLFEGALMIATSSASVSDVARGTPQGADQNNDFTTVQPYTLIIPGTAADVQGFTIFNDAAAGSNKLGVNVKLQSYSYANSPHQNYIILRYSITNNSGNNLSNLYAGLFFDWDLTAGGNNDYTSYDTAGKFGYVYHVGGDPDTWIGIALLSDGQPGFWAIDNSGLDGSFGINDANGFTDDEKWQSLSSGVGKMQAGNGDISNVIAGGPFFIPDNQIIDVAFVIAAGLNKDELANAVLNAKTKYQIILTDIEEDLDKLPEEFSLSQNYPNPFNPVTTIKYKIPRRFTASPFIKEGQEMLVTLKVYDILGNEITVLVNEGKLAGAYEVNFAATNLSSGVYFYKLTAGSFSETKKMILLR